MEKQLGMEAKAGLLPIKLFSAKKNGDQGYPSSVQLDYGSILTVYYQIDKPGEKTCMKATRWKL